MGRLIVPLDLGGRADAVRGDVGNAQVGRTPLLGHR